MRAPWRRRRRARGSTVVELALIVLLLVPVCACLVLLGSVLHRAAGLERAGYEAARYLASVPRQQMSTGPGYLAASAAAKAIANASLAAAGHPPLEPWGFDVTCNPCGSAILPQQVTVQLQATVAEKKWDVFTGLLLSTNNRLLTAHVTLRYEN
jgi:Flp pilus assembly protein TadG